MKSPSPRDARTKDTFSLGELARRWGMSRKDVRRLLGCGRLEFIEICGKLRVPEQAVRRHERQRRA